MGASFLPLVHAAHHLDARNYCSLCHFASGAPAIREQPLTVAPHQGPLATCTPVAKVHPPSFSGPSPVIRGPPASTP